MQDLNNQKPKKPLIRELFQYSFLPKYRKKTSKMSFLKKLWAMFRIWGIAITIALISGSFGAFVLEKVGYDQTDNAISEIFFLYNGWLLFLLAVVWAPVTEELTFRLFLRFSPYRLGISIMLFVLILLEIINNIWEIFNPFFEPLISNLNNIFFLLAIYVGIFLIFLLLGIGLGFIIKKLTSKKRLDKIENFFNKRFKFLFFSQAILFGFVHIFNYTDFTKIIYLTPFLVMPQTILGFMLGYVRIKFGLSWAMVLHAIYNAMITIPVIILFSLISDEGYHQLFIEGSEELPMQDVLMVFLIYLPVLFLIFMFYLGVNIHNLIELIKITKHNHKMEDKMLESN